MVLQPGGGAMKAKTKSPTLRERAANALACEPHHIYVARPGSGAPYFRVGNGYRYKGAPHFIAEGPVGRGLTLALAVDDLERRVAERDRDRAACANDGATS